jgi:hypothetical protein
MLEYIYKGKTETLKSELSEITLKEFIQILNLQKSSEADFEFYLDTFELLGFSKELCDAIDTKTLFKLISDFKDALKSDGEFIKQVEVEGYIYSAVNSFADDEFVINGREFSKIESKMKVDEFGWIAYAMAIIFKREDLSSVEHKDETHIKHKKSLFLDNVKMDVALPYVMAITKDYVDNIKILAS